MRTQLGDYWVGFDFEPYPDEQNVLDFEHICDPGVASWLKKNDWSTLSEIAPGEEVSC